jgi:hypothetical protein
MYNTDNPLKNIYLYRRHTYQGKVQTICNDNGKVLYAVCAVCIRNVVQEHNFLFDWIYYMEHVYEGRYNCHCKEMKILFILLLLPISLVTI